jgi:uncharacterized protein YxeA
MKKILVLALAVSMFVGCGKFLQSKETPKAEEKKEVKTDDDSKKTDTTEKAS